MNTQQRESATDGQTRIYRARHIEQILPRIREELGADAIVVAQREGLAGGVAGFFQQPFVEVHARPASAGTGLLDVYDEDESTDTFEPLVAAPKPAAPVLTQPTYSPAPAPAAPVSVAQAYVPGPEADVPMPAPKVDVPEPHAFVPAEEDAFPTRLAHALTPEELERFAAHLDVATRSAPAEPAHAQPQPVVAPQPEPEAFVAPEPEPQAFVAPQPEPQPIAYAPLAPQAPIAPEPQFAPEPEPIAYAPVAPQPEPQQPVVYAQPAPQPAVAPQPEPQAIAYAQQPVAPQQAFAPQAAPQQTYAAQRYPQPEPQPAVAMPQQTFVAPAPAPEPLYAQPAVDPKAESMIAALVAAGVTQELATEVVNETILHALPFGTPRQLKRLARETLARRVSTQPGFRGRRRAMAVVGAPGAGKTEVASRLAAAYHAGGNLPVRLVALEDGAELATKRVWATGSEGIAVVDTPAVSPIDGAGIAELAGQLAALDLDEVHVALPATLSKPAAEQLLDALAPLGPTHIVLTHADQTSHVGPAMSLAAERGIPFSFVHGSDLQPADAHDLAKRVIA